MRQASQMFGKGGLPQANSTGADATAPGDTYLTVAMKVWRNLTRPFCLRLYAHNAD